VNIRDVRTVGVERWLRQLRRADGDPLADTTKAKIRNLMSVLFNHAIRYEWLEQGKNPITLVRQSTKRKLIPEVLEPSEIQSLLRQLDSCFRVMVMLDATTGLRQVQNRSIAQACPIGTQCGRRPVALERIEPFPFS
jgi:site-specific recombinase XerD